MFSAQRHTLRPVPIRSFDGVTATLKTGLPGVVIGRQSRLLLCGGGLVLFGSRSPVLVAFDDASNNGPLGGSISNIVAAYCPDRCTGRSTRYSGATTSNRCWLSLGNRWRMGRVVATALDRPVIAGEFIRLLLFSGLPFGWICMLLGKGNIHRQQKGSCDAAFHE